MLQLLAAIVLLPAGEFRSIEASNGSHVVVRHGTVQRVSMIDGDTRCTHISIGSGKRLVINTSRHDCGRDYRAEVEVMTPDLSAVSVSNGGILRAVGAFPAQPAIDAQVEQGGILDIRSLPADRVDASVFSGGRIFTNCRKTLSASVESGGNITYWGDVEDLHKSVRDGGVVERGDADDLAKPLSKLGIDEFVPIPPIAPLPLASPMLHHSP